MKKVITLVLLTLTLFTTACKYEDGPKFSLRSKQHRAVNTWYLHQAFEDGVDKTESYKNSFVNYQVDLRDNDTYELKYRPFNLGEYKETGKWAFSSDKLTINFTPDGTTGSSKWKILRLKETETWVVQNINGKDVELHMKD